MKKFKKTIDWASVNDDLNAFYDNYVLTYLQDNFELNTKKASKKYPAFKSSEGTLLYFETAKNSHYCLVLNSANNKGYSPSHFMREFGPYSGLNKKDAFFKMRLEVYGEQGYIDKFGFLPKGYRNYQTFVKPKNFRAKPKVTQAQKDAQLKKEIEKSAKLYNTSKSGMGDQFINERGIGKHMAFDPRFANLRHKIYDFIGKNSKGKPERIFQKFVCVPHFHINKDTNQWEVCMVERIYDKQSGGLKKNTPGKKLLWKSDNFLRADTVVLTENVIDCISHAEIFGDTDYAYIALAGNISDIGKSCFQWWLNVANKNREKPINVVAAFDNDKAGAKYDNIIRDILPKEYGKTGNGDYLVIKTPKGFNDWNDLLKNIKGLDLKPENKVEINKNTPEEVSVSMK